MNKITVIDLLNMISKDEEVPKQVRFGNKLYKYDKEVEDYRDDDRYFLFDGISDSSVKNFLNDTVEIIEEQEEIDIQKLAEIPKLIHALSSEGIGENIDILVNQCNYLAQAVKQIDLKLKEK